MIFQGSRYETSTVEPVQAADGVYRATVIVDRELPNTFLYTVHQVIAGDRLELLANRAYGDPEMWWRIADANPDLFYPDDLVPGTLLKVPA